MRTNQEIKAIADGIYEEVSNALTSLTEVKANAVNAMLGKSGDEKLADIVALVADVEAVLKAPMVDGVALPHYLSKVTYEDGNLDTVTVTVRTKLKSNYKYRKDTAVAVNGEFIENAGAAFVSALYEMYYIEQALENVKALNAKVAEVLETAGVDYSFKFDVDTETDAMVLSINDHEVVFNANIARAHDISNIGIFKDGDEYNDIVREASTEKLVTALKAVQTPVQLIKGNVALIKDVTGVSTKKRASKLIRDSYHRKAKYLGSTKAGVGYFDETVSINGEDVDVFAIVSKDENGEFAVVLSPFDVKTLYNVDFDVIAAVKEQIAAE